VHKESKWLKHNYKEKHGEEEHRRLTKSQTPKNTKKVKQRNNSKEAEQGLGVGGAGACRLLAPARVDHASALENLSPAKEAASYCKPSTTKVGEEDRGHHAPSDEKHMLAHASHAPVCGCPEESWLMAMDAVDDGNPDGEVCVTLDVV
jgi:hypothetical protein